MPVTQQLVLTGIGDQLGLKFLGIIVSRCYSRTKFSEMS
jgi:hypothetical protein